jgi:hypothetical protein
VSPEQQRIESLQGELERIRAAADADLSNWTTKYTVLMRENSALKTRIERQETDEPEHDDVRDLLTLWKQETGRRANTDIGPLSKRYALAKTGVKRWGHQRCEHAIRGLALKPWAGPRGRSATEYPGANKHADVEHALGDEVRMERCEQTWLAHLTPSLLDPPAAEQPRPDPAPDNVVELRSPRKRRAIPWLDRPPIDKIIGALHEQQLRVVAHEHHPDNWSAQCPGHDDHDPSLSVHRKADGTVLLHCWAGCDTSDVLRAMRLDYSDLWENSERDNGRKDSPTAPRVLPAHLRHSMELLLSRGAA